MPNKIIQLDANLFALIGDGSLELCRGTEDYCKGYRDGDDAVRDEWQEADGQSFLISHG